MQGRNFQPAIVSNGRNAVVIKICPSFQNGVFFKCCTGLDYVRRFFRKSHAVKISEECPHFLELCRIFRRNEQSHVIPLRILILSLIGGCVKKRRASQEWPALPFNGLARKR